MSGPYLIICAEPAGGREQGSGEWRATAEVLGHDLAELASRTAIKLARLHGRPGPAAWAGREADR